MKVPLAFRLFDEKCLRPNKYQCIPYVMYRYSEFSIWTTDASIYNDKVTH